MHLRLAFRLTRTCIKQEWLCVVGKVAAMPITVDRHFKRGK
jgi:hypothetical protein